MTKVQKKSPGTIRVPPQVNSQISQMMGKVIKEQEAMV